MQKALSNMSIMVKAKMSKRLFCGNFQPLDEFEDPTLKAVKFQDTTFSRDV